MRVSLFVSRCRNRCKGCFQPETWNFCNGQPFTEITENEILRMLSPYYIKGLTIFGGDPFEEENQECLVSFMRKVKKAYPDKSVWAFTGYLLDKDLIKNGKKYTEYTEERLSMIDVLVDGPFIEEQKNLCLSFRGTEKQRILDVQVFLNTGEVKILNYDEKVE